MLYNPDTKNTSKFNPKANAWSVIEDRLIKIMNKIYKKRLKNKEYYELIHLFNEMFHIIILPFFIFYITFLLLLLFI